MIIPRLLASLVPLLGLRERDAFFRTVQNATDLFQEIKGDNGQNNCQYYGSFKWLLQAAKLSVKQKLPSKEGYRK